VDGRGGVKVRGRWEDGREGGGREEKEKEEIFFQCC